MTSRGKPRGNSLHLPKKNAMYTTIEKGNATQTLTSACLLFLTAPNYAEHRKLTLAMLALGVLLGMLFMG